MFRRFRAQDGAVSVYLILVIVPIFLFVSLFIDYARMKASELESEQALRAGVRSVMSAYEPKLAQWGLFGLGVDGEQSLQIMNQVLGQQMSVSSTFAFRYTNLKPDLSKTQLVPMYMLGNHQVFKRQVLEEMKYRAPLEFVLEIADKLKKPASIALMKDGSTFSSEAQSIEKLIDKREETLDRAWELVTDMHNRMIQLHGSYAGAINELRDLANRIGSETAASISERLSALADYHGEDQTSENEDADSDADDERERLQQILDWIAQYGSLLVQTKLNVQLHYSELSGMQQQIDDEISKARAANSDLKKELARLTSKPSAGTGPNPNAPAADETSLPAGSVFEHVKVYDDAYFSAFQSGAASVAALFAGFRSDVETIELYVGSNYDQVSRSNDAYRNRSEMFYQGQSVIEAERQKANENLNGQKKARRKEIENILELAKSALGNCGDNKALFEKLQGSNAAGSEHIPLYPKYMNLNQSEPGEEGNGVEFGLEQGEKTTSKSMDLLGQLAGMLESVRNELYIDEYALTKFNYRTFGLEKRPDGQPKKERSLTNPAGHLLANQEVEYLIYGFSSCTANLSSAYAEMFGIRFAIRTLEELTAPENELLNVGSPLLVLLSAAAQGAVKAYADMNALLQGDAVEISAKIMSSAFTFTYKDYLRLFLVLHSNDTKLMSRMQALIELNTGVDLARSPTYMESSATVSTSLWFSSGFMKLLELGGNAKCTVTSNRCEFVKTAAMSY